MRGPLVSKRVWRAPATFVGMVFLCASAWSVVQAASCGGEGRPAPYTISPDDETSPCPSADALLPRLRAWLRDDSVAAVRPHIERVMVEERGLATILRLVAAALPDLPDDVASTLFRSLWSADGKSVVDVVTPNLVAGLAYLDGSNPDLPGSHEPAVEAMHSLLAFCDVPTAVVTARDWFALEVRAGEAGSARWVRAEPSVPSDAQGRGLTMSWWSALLQALDRAAVQPTLSGFLERIEVTDDDVAQPTGTVRVGRDAFLVLAQLIAENVAAPDFDVHQTRTVVQDILFPQLSDDAEAAALVDEILDLAVIVVAPESAELAGVQESMRCALRHDPEAALPAMVFDFLTNEATPVRPLVAELASATESEEAGRLRLAVVALLAALASHPLELADAASVVARLLEPGSRSEAIQVAASAMNNDVLAELVSFLETLSSCRESAP